jgi:ferredoxin
MEAARTSETSFDIQLTRQYIPEDSELHCIFCEISGYHSVEYEAQNLLGCAAVFLMEAARTSETSVDIQLTRQYIPEDSELHCIICLRPSLCSRLLQE